MLSLNQLVKKVMNTSHKPNSHYASVTVEDQKRLEIFFRNELNLYNKIIATFEARTRGMSGFIASLTEQQIELFSQAVAHNVGLEGIKTAQDCPECFSKLHDTIWDATGKNRLHPQLLLMIKEVVPNAFVLVPETKYQMARGIAEFFRDQAEILQAPQHSDIVEISYKTSPTNISQLDSSIKRHVQLPRRCVNLNYNSEQDCTEIFTPLNASAITVPGVNLKRFHHWTNMIIRRDRNENTIDFNAPWVVELRNTKDRYLIKLKDSVRKKKTPKDRSRKTKEFS
jgi:hypothetical protein